MKKIPLFLLVSLVLACFVLQIEARQPYHATVTVDTSSAKVSAPNLVDLSRDLRENVIEALIPIYTPISPVSIDINLRGIKLLTSFAANSTALVVSIPQLGETQTFDGGTRDQSIQLLKESIRDGGMKHHLLRAYTRFSPIDPLAGNPNSLMAQMAQFDYALGRLSPLSGCDCSWSAQPILHQFQAGLIAGRAFCKGFDTTLISLPLRYSYSPDFRWALIIDVPVTYLRNGGASSIFSSLGTGLRIPITGNWSLTPIFRLGSGGSVDLCTAGAFIDVGATSNYNYKITEEYLLSITNYAGYFSSINLWLSGINFNPELHNYVFKNGLTVTTCEEYYFCGRPVNLSLAFVDSLFTRDHLFIRHYDEMTFSLIARHILPCLCYDLLSIGITCQWGEKHYKGFYLSTIYQF